MIPLTIYVSNYSKKVYINHSFNNLTDVLKKLNRDLQIQLTEHSISLYNKLNSDDFRNLVQVRAFFFWFVLSQFHSCPI